MANNFEGLPSSIKVDMDPILSDTEEYGKRSHEALEEDLDTEAAKRQKIDKGQALPVQKKVNHEQWDAMFERLVEYKNTHGDCLVPKRYTADPKLGTWVETQRVQYKRLEREVDLASGVEAVQPNKRLNQERLAKLQSIGFVWSAKNARKTSKSPAPTAAAPKLKKAPSEEQAARSKAERSNKNADTQWEEMYQRLVQYKEKYGDCLVPRKYEADPRLGTWVETQRVLWNRDFREGSGALPLPEPTAIPTVASLGKSPEEWAEEMHKSDEALGATMEDAAEVAATMNNEHHMNVEGMEEEAQNEAVVAAVAAAAAEVVEESLKVPAVTRRLTQERKDKLDALGFVWSLRSKRIDDHWDEMFRQLAEYKEKYGDCLVPSRYEENLKLGKWVETQRYEYTKLQRTAGGAAIGATADTQEVDASGKPRPTNQRLTDERLRRLESIGFEWKVKHKMKRYYDKQWDQMFERLLKYKNETGHCMVPKRYPPDMKLGTWVHTQRIQYRRMLAGTKVKDGDTMSDQAGTDEAGSRVSDSDEISFRLTEERRKRLEEVGFVWSAREGEKGATGEQGRITRNSYDDQWDAMFNRLVAYKEKYGNCLVPKRHKDDPKLGTWVDTQRVQYKKMKKKMAEQSLDIDGATKIKTESGDAAVKPVVGRLTDERIRRLEELGFVWSLRDDWQKHYEELKQYRAETGNCNVPARYAKNRRLGIWVSAQRQQYKIMHQPDDGSKSRRSAPLTQERIDLLNKIGFIWTIRSRDSLGESWNQRLEDLRKYRATHGDCLVPSRYPPNPELGVWVGTQRTQYRLYMKAKEAGQLPGNSAMTEDRIRQLEELGFVWALRVSTELGKKEPDQMNTVAIDEEAMQVARELADTHDPNGDVHDPNGDVHDPNGDVHDHDTDAILHAAMGEHAEI